MRQKNALHLSLLQIFGLGLLIGISLLSPPAAGNATDRACGSPIDGVQTERDWLERVLAWSRIRARGLSVGILPECSLEMAGALVQEAHAENNERFYVGRIRWLAERAPRDPALFEFLELMQQAWLLERATIIFDRPSHASALVAGSTLAVGLFLAVRYSPFSSTRRSRAVRKMAPIYLRATTYLAGRLGLASGGGALETIGDQVRSLRQARVSRRKAAQNSDRSARPSPAEIANLPGLAQPESYSDQSFLADMISLGGNVGAGLAVNLGVEAALRSRRGLAIRALLPRFIAPLTNPLALGILSGAAVGLGVDESIDGYFAESARVRAEQAVENSLALATTHPEKLASAILQLINYFVEIGGEERWQKSLAVHRYISRIVCRDLDFRSTEETDAPSWPRREISTAAWHGWNQRARVIFARELNALSGPATLNLSLSLHQQLERWTKLLQGFAGSRGWLPWYDLVLEDLLSLSEQWASNDKIINFAEAAAVQERAVLGAAWINESNKSTAREISRRWSCAVR